MKPILCTCCGVDSVSRRILLCFYLFIYFWHNIYLQVRLGWKMMQLWKANSLSLLHTTWDVSPDCSKVTSSTRILPSHVAAHNNTLPQSSPPCSPVSPFFLSIQLPVWSGDWFFLICSTHIHQLDTANQPPLSRRSSYSAGDCFCAQSFLIKILVHC